MIYRTCIGCVKAKEPCNHRDFLRQKLAGIGITSIKFSCAIRTPLFEPGDQVSVWLLNYEEGDGYREPATEACEATVIKCVGTKVLAYVHPNEDTDYVLKNESRFVKVSAQHVSKREGERRIVCPICSSLDGEHEYGWTCHHKAKLEREAAEREAAREAEVIF